MMAKLFGGVHTYFSPLFYIFFLLISIYFVSYVYISTNNLFILFPWGPEFLQQELAKVRGRPPAYPALAGPTLAVPLTLSPPPPLSLSRSYRKI